MRKCYVLRVFTKGDAGGNHLGVITNPGGLSAIDMQGIALELGFSETVFVDWERHGPPHVRIFTPGAEVPFAGHPLVGAAWIVGVMGPDGADRLVCGIGEVGFTAGRDGASVDAPMATDVAVAPEGPTVAGRSGLPAPVGSWWARMPIPYLVLEAASAGDVTAANPDFAALAAGPSAEATYLFAREGDGVHARFFAPALGVDEDPATGSAAAALAAVLSFEGEKEGRLRIAQGEEIGHPSEIEMSWREGLVSLTGTVRRDEVRALER